MSNPNHQLLDSATQAYQAYQKDWQFLGYSEPVAVAVLGEFFGMKKKKGRRNSLMPLNVLSVVGKPRILMIKKEVQDLAEAVNEQTI